LKQAAGRRAWLVALFVFAGPALGQPPEPLAERLKGCAVCHGADGNSQTPGVPSIAGQPKLFLETQLVLTREGLRGTPVMQNVVRGMSDKEIIAIATHFTALPVRTTPGKTDVALVERGWQLAVKHRCGICHLKDYRGQQQIPRLAGQREEYLVSIMIAFRDNPPPSIDTQMSAALYGVSDAEIAAMAHFLSRFQ